VDEQEWIRANAAQARRALADPSVLGEVLALLDGRERDRARRQAAARAELADMEVRWRLGDEEWTLT
jgi:hypothetical protein